MATSFVIEPGYQSGYLDSTWEGEEFRVLSELMTGLINRPLELREMAYWFGFSHTLLENKDFHQWASEYLATGVTIDPERKTISIGASGGNPARANKEAIALAVCHYLFRECAHRGFTVSISIA